MRVGLLKSLVDRLHPNCLILLDHCQREEEMNILTTWSRQMPLHCTVEGVEKQFARIELHLGAGGHERGPVR